MAWFAVRASVELSESRGLSFLANGCRELLRKVIWPHSQEGVLERPMLWWCAQVGLEPDQLRKALSELASMGACSFDESFGRIKIDLGDFFAPCVADRDAARKSMERSDKSDELGQVGRKPPTVRDDTRRNGTHEKNGHTSSRPRRSSPDVEAVIAHYVSKKPKTKPGAKERSKIAARLQEGFTVDELKEAIDGCLKAPFTNERGKTFDSLELIVRDSGKVNQYRNGAPRALTYEEVIGESGRGT